MIIEKKCSCCGETKSVNDFHKKKSAKDGRRSQCKSCRAIEAGDRYLKNKKQILEKHQQYYQNNKEDCLRRNALWISNNPDKRKAIDARQNLKRKSNKDFLAKVRKSRKIKYLSKRDEYIARAVLRKAAKLQATPRWLHGDHKKEMADFYKAAKMFQLYTGTEYHVDHIVPLQGETVCGLHVPWNLQLLPWDENLSKQHRYWPDMPEQE